MADAKHDPDRILLKSVKALPRDPVLAHEKGPQPDAAALLARVCQGNAAQAVLRLRRVARRRPPKPITSIQPAAGTGTGATEAVMP